VPYAYQYITFLLSICKVTANEPLDYRARRKVANFISQNSGTDWEQLLKNHNKLHLPVKTTPLRVRSMIFLNEYIHPKH
jgi:hypothetical protein